MGAELGAWSEGPAGLKAELKEEITNELKDKVKDGIIHEVKDEGSQTRHSKLEPINREDFPILEVDAYPGVPLVYLDSGASSQKPKQVLDAMDTYYRTSHANVH